MLHLAMHKVPYAIWTPTKTLCKQVKCNGVDLKSDFHFTSIDDKIVDIQQSYV